MPRTFNWLSTVLGTNLSRSPTRWSEIYSPQSLTISLTCWDGDGVTVSTSSSRRGPTFTPRKRWKMTTYQHWSSVRKTPHFRGNSGVWRPVTTIDKCHPLRRGQEFESP